MVDYAAMYRKLFAVQADAIDKLQEMTNCLIQAHKETEELYISAAQPNILVLQPNEVDVSGQHKHK